MCTISGYVSLSPEKLPQRKFCEHLVSKKLLPMGVNRGRDAWGVIFAAPNEGSVGFRDFGKYTERNFELRNLNPTAAIMNNRAAPTTENVKDIKLSDLQPYSNDHWAIVHNGTISNDEELRKLLLENGIQVKSKIDSAVILGLCELFDKQYPAEVVDMEKRLKFLNKHLKGSFALAVMSLSGRGKANAFEVARVGIMCNYKPIYVTNYSNGQVITFTSLEEISTNANFEDWMHQGTWTKKLKPYSAMILTSNNLYDQVGVYSFDLDQPEDSKTRTLVVCSGGLDSTVVAAKCVADGHQVELLHFLYGCKAEEREVEAIIKIAKRLNVKANFINIKDTFKSIGGSTLLLEEDRITEAMEGSEFAHEWVPCRNLILLSIAAGYAESHGFNKVALGNNLEESGAYPDNEMEFINMLNNVMPYATQVNTHVEFIMPVGNLMKKEIVELGSKVNAPFDVSWSCYRDHGIHCGKCGPCGMRKTAFKIANVEDPTEYEDNSTFEI